MAIDLGVRRRSALRRWMLYRDNRLGGHENLIDQGFDGGRHLGKDR